jgi:hypothetical protein
MNHNALIASLHHHARAIELLTRGLSDEQARFKPDANAWSVLEVINHLYDEEREDFRVRLDIILHRPTEPWPPIRPAEWVTERAYNTRDLDASVTNFITERDNSLKWLNSLGTPNWEAAVTAPWGGEFKAGDMFSSWAAHDVLHLRQLTELHYALVKEDAQPYKVRYAGDW